MESDGSGEVVVLLLIVIDGCDFGDSLLEGFEIAVEGCILSGAVGIDVITDMAVGAVAPAADAYLDAIDGCGLGEQTLDVADVIGLILVEDVLAVAADDAAGFGSLLCGPVEVGGE